MKIDYQVTEQQLLDYGLSMRIITLAKEWWMRKGQVDFDIQYALSIWEAKDKVNLAALAINNPQLKSVHYPPHAPYMGMVRL